MGKYVKCPRCELNYILAGEDYCHVCKSEMKHHSEQDEDELLDFDEMDICSVCGTNYVKENETICSDCRAKMKGEKSSENWEDEGESQLVSTDADDGDEENEEYNSGFSDIDPENDDIDPYKIDDDVDIDDSSDGALDFAMEEEIDESFDESINEDDFETVEVSDEDDEEDDEEDEDDFDLDDDDMLGKKK